jgi:hypothetical protein
MPLLPYTCILHGSIDTRPAQQGLLRTTHFLIFSFSHFLIFSFSHFLIFFVFFVFPRALAFTCERNLWINMWMEIDLN